MGFQNGKGENSARRAAAAHGGKPTRSWLIERRFIRWFVRNVGRSF